MAFIYVFLLLCARQQFNIFTNNKHKAAELTTPEQFPAINITKDETYSNQNDGPRARSTMCEHFRCRFQSFVRFHLASLSGGPVSIERFRPVSS